MALGRLGELSETLEAMQSRQRRNEERTAAASTLGESIDSIRAENAEQLAMTQGVLTAVAALKQYTEDQLRALPREGDRAEEGRTDHEERASDWCGEGVVSGEEDEHWEKSVWTEEGDVEEVNVEEEALPTFTVRREQRNV